MTYPGQRPELPSLPHHFLLALSELSDVKFKDTCVINKKTKAGILRLQKCFNCTLALTRLNYGNLRVIYFDL